MSTFQTRFYEDHFPIGRLIASRAQFLGLTRRQLVERLDFDDRLAKGHQVLAEMMTTGIVPSYVTTLAAALELDQTVVDRVLHLTAWQQEAEWLQDMLVHEELYRASFKPHLHVKTERNRPEPIFIAAMLTVEQLRLVCLPEEIDSADEKEREQIVREAIQKHYRNRHGSVPAFGRITGYFFVCIPGFGGVDFGVPYDRHGSRTGEMVLVRRIPEATLGIRPADTRLTGFLRNSSVNDLNDHEASDRSQ
jgi:hypothetical protein